MKITLLEPFFSGSHRQWAEGYQRYSRHQVSLLTLPGRHWKWRMHGGAVSLARKFLAEAERPDLLLATDMLDLTSFLALTRPHSDGLPVALYLHENQITYPWSPTDPDPELGRNRQYGFINYTSALAADRLLFNSDFHRRSFLSALEVFLRQFPDHRETDLVAGLAAKSDVLPLGLDLASLDTDTPIDRPSEPVLLWNHRWEYDKAPEVFFRVVQQLQKRGVKFRLIVLGEAYRDSPAVFDEARRRLADSILHFGYAPDRLAYARYLHQADIIPVTSRQDFFGAGAVEAIYCNCYPLLPDRLAFPEHIPADKRSRHLYQNEEELYSALETACKQIENIRKQSHFRDFVSHYDWRILAPRYDQLLESMLVK